MIEQITKLSADDGLSLYEAYFKLTREPLDNFSNKTDEKIDIPENPTEFVEGYLIPNIIRGTAHFFEQNERIRPGFMDIYRGFTFNYDSESGDVIQDVLPNSNDRYYMRVANSQLPQDHLLSDKSFLPENKRDGQPPRRPKKNNWYIAIEPGTIDSDNVTLLLYGEAELREDTRGCFGLATFELPRNVALNTIVKMTSELVGTPRLYGKNSVLSEILYSPILKIGRPNNKKEFVQGVPEYSYNVHPNALRLIESNEYRNLPTMSN